MRYFYLAICTLVLLYSACKSSVEQKKEQIHTFDVTFPSFSPDFPPPAGEKNVFSLSQDYPDTFNRSEKYPWETIDFKTDFRSYMQAVLNYCLEGNVEVDFDVQRNSVRKWYHAPWLHYGLNGREYHHGLTRERAVPPFELHKQQDVGLENWAIGFYNQPGGYSIGKVWKTDSIPNLKMADFPEGTVSFKLLFTTGTANQVPYLKGTKEWAANIYPCSPDLGSAEERAKCKQRRIDSSVRLLQIDIAVKDKRAGETGWVFGTFIYDASNNGKNLWENIVPVGLMWGDDSQIDTMINREGAFVNPYLKQTYLNEKLIATSEMALGNKAYMTHHGLGGRLNGPVDNPISSCISCHSKSAVTSFGSPAPMANFKLTRKTFTKGEFRKYFATIGGGAGILTIDSTQYHKLDYSLQLSAGIRNFYQSKIDIKKAEMKKNNPNLAPEAYIEDLPEVTRDGLKE
jgi:hypothetical protein